MIFTPDSEARYRRETHKQIPYLNPQMQSCPVCKRRRSLGQFAPGKKVCNTCKGGKR